MSHESRLSIRAGEVDFYESRGKVIDVTISSTHRITVSLELTGEGQTWRSTREFVLSEDGRRLNDIGGLSRMRCR